MRLMIAYEIFNLQLCLSISHKHTRHIFSVFNNDRNVTTIKITSNKNLLNGKAFEVYGCAFIKVRETKKILRHDRPQRTVYLL